MVFRARRLSNIILFLRYTPGRAGGPIAPQRKVTTMKDEEIKNLLSAYKTVAVVGISPKPDRPSHVVASYLQSKGYRIIPVRPDGEVVLGEKVYRSLDEIPKEMGVDIVDVFRKSAEVLPIVEEAVERGAKMIWMQEGVVNQDAAAKAEKAGLRVVMDRCIKKEHQRLI
jgi:uncharacterized protein